MKKSDPTKLYKETKETFLGRVIFETVDTTGRWKIVKDPLEEYTLYIETINKQILSSKKEWVSESILFTVYDVNGGIFETDRYDYTETINECAK